MKSMTGFGTSRKNTKGVLYEASVRSVNGRFFDLKVHLPSELAFVEKEIRDVVTSRLERGSVSVVVLRKRSALDSHKTIEFDEVLAQQWMKGLEKLSKKLKIKNDLAISQLASHSQFMIVKEDSEMTPTEKKTLLAAVTEAVSNLEAEREREGKNLRSDISKRVDQLDRLCAAIEETREEANAQMKARMEKRIEDLQLKSFDSSRVSDELVWFLDKSDINEELIRLNEHLSHFKTLLNAKSSEGKKLDFYTQELLREINTIGSKANHAKITQSVVDAKALIEQIKEQVQNVE